MCICICIRIVFPFLVYIRVAYWHCKFTSIICNVRCVCAHDIRNASKIDKIVALIIRITLCCQHKHGHGSSKTYQQITKISNWHHIYFLSLTKASGSHTHIYYVLLTAGITSTLLSSFKLKVPRRLSGIHSFDSSIFAPPIVYRLCIVHTTQKCALCISNDDDVDLKLQQHNGTH